MLHDECNFFQKFQKEYLSNKNKKLAIFLNDSLNQVTKATRIEEVKGIKKLKGFKNAYRIKKGDYRIGIIFENNEVQFIIFDHRKDIYKIFP